MSCFVELWSDKQVRQKKQQASTTEDGQFLPSSVENAYSRVAFKRPTITTVSI